VNISNPNATDNLLSTDVNQYSIFPNPSSSEFQIQSIEKAYVQVYSLHGQLMANYTAVSSNTKINCSNWPAGIYMIQIKEGKKAVVKQFIKQ
jgi:hypothetical protein